MEAVEIKKISEPFKYFITYILLCYLSGLIYWFCDVKKTNLNLDEIKSHELFNLFFSCFADFLAFVPLSYYYKDLKKKKEEVKSKAKKKDKNDKKEIIKEIELIYNEDENYSPSRDAMKYLIVSFFLEFIEKSLTLTVLHFIEDKKVLDTNFFWVFSLDYVLRCMLPFILDKIARRNSYISKILIVNSLILLISGLASFYVIFERIQYYQILIIVIKVLIFVIMDSLNYHIMKNKNYHPFVLMSIRGIVNFVLFVIFLVVLLLFSKGFTQWIFSFLYKGCEYSVILFIISKILYILSLGMQKLALLLILYHEDLIMASFCRIIFYSEPYASMSINIIFYNEKFKIRLLEIIFEIINGLCFLFTAMTSTDCCLLCNCLKKYSRAAIIQRAIDETPIELDAIEEEKEEEKEEEEEDDDEEKNRK